MWLIAEAYKELCGQIPGLILEFKDEAIAARDALAVLLKRMGSLEGVQQEMQHSMDENSYMHYEF